MKNKIYVFGSNLAGRHGKGAALYARQKHGAIYGQGVGLQGNSYGIPTKDENLKVLPLDVIAEYVSQFVQFARNNPSMEFFVSAVGCGLAGYHPSEIVPLFGIIPNNVMFNNRFIDFEKPSVKTLFD